MEHNSLGSVKMVLVKFVYGNRVKYIVKVHIQFSSKVGPLGCMGYPLSV